MKKLHLLISFVAMLFATVNLWAQKDVPLTFEAIEAGAEVSFRLSSSTIMVEYSTDGSTWITYTSETPITLTNVGDKVSFHGLLNHQYGSSTRNSSSVFSCTKDCYVYGNVMSLRSEDYFTVLTDLSGTNDVFAYLFSQNIHIKNHPTKTLELPATKLSNRSYKCMFEGCTGLTAAPILPTTKLSIECYYGMFSGCTNLSYVECYATNHSAERCIRFWLNNVAATGTLVAPVASPTWVPNSPHGIPDGWTRIAPGTYLNLQANEDPQNAGVYYATFFDSSVKYALPNDGTKAYVAELSSTDLLLHEIASGAEVLPANTAVILQSPSSSITLTSSDAAPVTVSATNCLLGTDGEMAAPANCYVISGHSSDNSVQGVGFYQYTGTLKAHKAYTIYGGGSGAPQRMRFIFEDEQQATGVENVQGDKVQSTKIIENGQVIIIRNGVRYNAAGQIVK